MKWVTRLVLGIFGIWLAMAPVVGVNAATPELLIVEIQTASKTSASQELVRIANTTTKTVSLSGVRLEYFSASPQNISVPSRTFNLSGALAAGKTYLLTSKDYLVENSNQQYTATLAAAGGHLRLSSGVITNPNTYDFVGWGTAKHARGAAAKAPAAGEILARKKDAAGKYIHTNNNLADFVLPSKSAAVTAPKPSSSTPSSQASSSSPGPSNAPRPGSSSAGSNTNFTGISITELMPNPAKPQTDAKDEFIELHNSSGRTIKLAGLTVLSGAKLNHDYSFKSGSIGAGQYKALYVSVSKLTLTNSGGKAELRSPNGKLIGKSVNYDKAKDGLSYSWDGTGWQWSSIATPGAKNIISGSDAGSSGVDGASELGDFGSGGSGNVKSATTSKKAEDKAQARPVNSKIIAGVGSLGLLYGLYEYRTDIANLYQKLRGNRGSRSKDR